MTGAVGFSFTPIGRAFARRLGGGADADATRELRTLQAEVDDLRAELESVRDRLGEVDELHSRIDFAERMLAQHKAQGALPKGAS